MKRSAKPVIARVVSAERAFAIVEAGIAAIVADIARRERKAPSRRKARAA